MNPRVFTALAAAASLGLAACTHLAPTLERHTVELAPGIVLTVEIEPFVATAHQLHYCSPQQLCAIDGYPVFGTEGALPRQRLERLRVQVHGQTVALEHRGMFNPWSPIEDRKVAARLIDSGPNGLRIRAEFADGAAAYVAEWLVQGPVSARTRIDCIECAALSCKP